MADRRRASMPAQTARTSIVSWTGTTAGAPTDRTRRRSLLEGSIRLPPSARSQMGPTRTVSKLQLLRERAGDFMLQRSVEIFFIGLIIIYAGLVIASLVLPDDVNGDVTSGLWIAELVLLFVFAAELSVKFFAFGWVLFRSCWNVFDAVIIIVSIAVSFVEMYLNGLMLLRVLRLRAVIRLVRLGVVLSRCRPRIRPSAKHRLSSTTALQSPLERSIFMLQQLLITAYLDDSEQDDVRFVIDALRSGDLYRPVRSDAESRMDHETKDWFKAQFSMTAPGRSVDALPLSLDTEDVDESKSEFGGSSALLGSSRMLSPSTAWAAASTNNIPPMFNVNEWKAMPAPARVQALKAAQMKSRMQAQSNRDLSLLVNLEALKESHSVRSFGSESASTRGLAGMHSGSFTARARARRAVLAEMKILCQRALQWRRCFQHIDKWVFDIEAARESSAGHPLFVVAYNLLAVHSVASELNLDDAVLQRVLLRIEEGYASNPYHNSLHAADVTQTINYFISQPLLLPYLRSLDVFAALMAAAVHDYAHPGVNNAFMVATQHDIAVRYNDAAVLENMHVASFFQIIKAGDCQLLAGFSRDDFKKVRSLMIAMVLSTDMAKHFEELGKFKARLVDHLDPEGPPPTLTASDAAFFLQMALHTSDVSNPAKALCHYKRWTELVVAEFFSQGDQEREAGLPISPFFDRSKPNVPKLQLSFIEYIVSPLFMEWAKVVVDVATTVVPLMQMNRLYWERKAAAMSEAHERRRSSRAAARRSVVEQKAAPPPGQAHVVVPIRSPSYRSSTSPHGVAPAPAPASVTETAVTSLARTLSGMAAGKK